MAFEQAKNGNDYDYGKTREKCRVNTNFREFDHDELFSPSKVIQREERCSAEVHTEFLCSLLNRILPFTFAWRVIFEYDFRSEIPISHLHHWRAIERMCTCK